MRPYVQRNPETGRWRVYSDRRGFLIATYPTLAEAMEYAAYWVRLITTPAGKWTP